MSDLPVASESQALVPSFLEDTSHERTLAALYALYRGVDQAIAQWQQASGLGCPAGCGNCCRRYEPTVLPVEAMAVAAYISARRPELVPLLSGPRTAPAGRCPFYDVDNPLHCRVYPSRPLECRLFAFASVRRKDGRPQFRLCRDMPGPEPRIFDEATLGATYGATPPVMQDAAARLQALDGGPTHLLGEHARAAWATLQYLRALKNRGGTVVAATTEESYHRSPARGVSPE